jgi:hypothetical protein
MPAQKQTFVFPDAAGAAMPVEARAANALEFIAHYLDRIEGHLEQLSKSQVLGSLEGIRMELTGITEFVKKLKP